MKVVFGHIFSLAAVRVTLTALLLTGLLSNTLFSHLDFAEAIEFEQTEDGEPTSDKEESEKEHKDYRASNADADNLSSIGRKASIAGHGQAAIEHNCQETPTPPPELSVS